MGSRISLNIQSGSSRFRIPDLPSSTTVLAVKKEIFQYTGIFINNQTLKFKGVVLQDRNTLGECGIKTENTIEVEERGSDSQKIFIESIHGNNLITLDYNPDDTILSIKRYFLRDLNIEIERQKLFFTTILLQDNEKLSKYKIQEGTKLRLEITQLDPNCIMIEMPTGPVLDLEYNEDLTIDNLKQTISSTAMIHTDEIRLFFKEEQLEARKSLSKYHIKVGDTLKLKLRPKGEIIIYIDAPTTKQTVTNLTLENTISDIKVKITNEANIPLEKQSLYLEGVVLENERTLLHSGIEDGSVIKLVLEGPTIMSIFVRYNSEKIPIDVDSKSTVLNLKTILVRETKVPVEAQKLVFAGKLLEDDKELSSYRIQKEVTVHLIQQFKKEEIQIVVKTHNDNDFPISVLPQTKIYAIKETIAHKESGAADQYLLTFSGRILEDNSRVSSYEIVNESCLHMELKREDNDPQPPVRMRSRDVTGDPFRNPTSSIQDLPQPILNQQHDDLPALFEPPRHYQNFDSPQVSYARENIGPRYSNERIPLPQSNKYLATEMPDLPPPNYRSFSPSGSTSGSSAIPERLPYNPFPYRSNIQPMMGSGYGRQNVTVGEYPSRQYVLRNPSGYILPDQVDLNNFPLPPPFRPDHVLMQESYKIENTRDPLPEHKISIRVSFLCSEAVNIEIKDNATILEVKRAIKIEKGFIEEHQKIYFNDSICGDTQILTDLEIVDNSGIQVDILYSWNVCFLHHQMIIKCYASSNIADIKNSIFEKEKIPVENQRLFLEDRELSNEQSLSHYQPGQNLKFTLEITKNILILFSSGKTFILHSCHVKISGKFIKEQIYQNFKIPVENQTLTYLGKEIKDDLTLEDIKYREENKIIINIDFHNSRWITVLLKLSNGDQQLIKIRSLDTVGKLKSLVNTNSSLLVDDHDFTYNHCNLSDENIIDFYQIRNYEEISMFSSEFKVVNMTLLSGCVEPFCLKHFQNLENIKRRMQNQFRLPPNYNKLFFGKIRNVANINPQHISNGESVFIGPNNSILVSILSSNSRIIEILIIKEERVFSLKQKIEMKEHIPIHVQQLSFEGISMDNDTCIGNFNISPNSTIFLNISEEPISIYLRDDANNTIHFPQIDRYLSVRFLMKNLIQMGYTIRKDDLFVFEGTVLHSNAPLCYYGIQNGCNLRFISKTASNCLSSSHRGCTSDNRIPFQAPNQFSTPIQHQDESVPSIACTSCMQIQCICVVRLHSHTESNIGIRPRRDFTPYFNRPKSGPIHPDIQQPHHNHAKISEPYPSTNLPQSPPFYNTPTNQDRSHRAEYQPPSNQHHGNYHTNYD
ncbi:Polyubiquitin [Oopsacas minuta]|uniref:Polyubiquitin n=1 Tax=Oopsacas minuta TaxID=111878 RepID=A0AAV7KJ80_9METZ|nr:Polyubiquitin [Oopsacas minuta]